MGRVGAVSVGAHQPGVEWVGVLPAGAADGVGNSLPSRQLTLPHPAFVVVREPGR
jgi:hypothetical protein